LRVELTAISALIAATWLGVEFDELIVRDGSFLRTTMPFEMWLMVGDDRVGKRSNFAVLLFLFWAFYSYPTQTISHGRKHGVPMC
jgi:hypothetical protein